MAPYKIKKECHLLRHCLIGAGRMLLFMVEQVFLLMGEVRSMHNVDTGCSSVQGERRQRAEKCSMFILLLSCHKI